MNGIPVAACLDIKACEIVSERMTERLVTDRINSVFVAVGISSIGEICILREKVPIGNEFIGLGSKRNSKEFGIACSWSHGKLIHQELTVESNNWQLKLSIAVKKAVVCSALDPREVLSKIVW